MGEWRTNQKRLLQRWREANPTSPDVFEYDDHRGRKRCTRWHINGDHVGGFDRRKLAQKVELDGLATRVAARRAALPPAPKSAPKLRKDSVASDLQGSLVELPPSSGK